ncbi:MAG: hypothetical protein D6785_12940 [Planctomycetota bacterium]|nr:MAG: hypothetical protein D6785_12940 [Planctomycetota bacterium]
MFNWYLFWKMVHLFSVVLWTGTTLGGYWFVLQGIQESKSLGYQTDKELWLRKKFIFLANLEHLAFLGIIISAFAMIWILKAGFFQISFIKWKLILFFSFLLPMEIIDVYLTNFLLAPVLRKKENLEKERLEKALKYHDRFYLVMTFLLPWIILAMFYLAVFKPSF